MNKQNKKGNMIKKIIIIINYNTGLNKEATNRYKTESLDT